MGRFFQIYENGSPISEEMYGNFEMVCLVWAKSPSNREVFEVDSTGKVIRRFTEEECWRGARKFQSTLKHHYPNRKDID
jgi:hypothetical protein